jgi:glycosyltransferase involved in cell wall biosynthesis
MSPIYYDLTELYLRSRGKIKYYGIARVVAEIAFEISRIAPTVQFVVFDIGRRQFFKANPIFGEAGFNGLVDLGLPARGLPFRMPEPKPHHSTVRALLQNAAVKAAKIVNSAIFPDIDEYLQPISLDGGVLISAARPKFIADMAAFLADIGSSVRLNAVIYDLIPLHDELPIPDGFRQSFIDDNAQIFRNAHQVISISHFTDKDLCSAVEAGRLPRPASHVVVPLGHECRSDGEVADIELPKNPYFLGVGITMGRKNLDVVLNAIVKMLDAGKQPPVFVVAGIDRIRNRKALRQSAFARADPYVQFVNAPNQANLIKLYENALGTVMASKLEGWGLPLAESLWLGTPGVSTPNSSLPEVGGDLAVYFNPDDPDELAAIFDRFMNDKDYYNSLRARVRASKPQLRSWADVAGDLLSTAKSNDAIVSRPHAA